jgi:hypothetical protein
MAEKSVDALVEQMNEANRELERRIDEKYPVPNSRIDRFDQALKSAIVEGIGAAVLTEVERRGVVTVVDMVFDGGWQDSEDAFDEKAYKRAKTLAAELSHSRLLRKFLGVWWMEEAASDGKDVPDGILGRALDQAADQIRPYLHPGIMPD